MVNGFPAQGTDPKFGQEDFQVPKLTPKQECEAKGGVWDAENRVCILGKKKEEPEKPPKVKSTEPEVLTKDGEVAGVILPDGRIIAGGDIGRSEVEAVLQGEQKKSQTLTSQAIAGQEQFQLQQQQRREGAVLAGQVGQFGQLGVDPTGLRAGEALTTGVVDAIPRALTLAGGAAVAGATLGVATSGGILSAPLAIAGAAVTFVGSMAASMISNFKSQRTDTTTAQQRVLDEGKQNMADWVTLAGADPANRNSYLAEYNRQSALIDQSYRQMKLDTSRDLAKFETALPSLAEYETFYSTGGERDALDADMRTSLLTASPEGYDMLAMTARRQNNER